MNPELHLILTDVGLRAARDCRSRKVRPRLRAAMKAVLSKQYRAADEETALMAAIAGTMRVVDDRSSEMLQKELYALGQISNKMAGADIPDEAIQMPTNPVGILIMWEKVRTDMGIFRPVDNPFGLPEGDGPEMPG